MHQLVKTLGETRRKTAEHLAAQLRHEWDTIVGDDSAFGAALQLGRIAGVDPRDFPESIARELNTPTGIVVTYEDIGPNLPKAFFGSQKVVASIRLRILQWLLESLSKLEAPQAP